MTERRKDHNVIIERLDSICDRLDNVEIALKDLKPVSQGLVTLNSLKQFGGYWAGVLTPWTVVVGFVYWIITYIK